MLKKIGLSVSDFKNDFKASIFVFLVALPLAMGISVASGYPPIAGIITGIIGGIVVGLFSGAPLQVSGTAAGLTVLVYQGVEKFGLAQMGLVIFVAGILQIIAAMSRLGRWFQAVSPTLLHAMLAGIGLLIMMSQFHVMFDQTPQGNGIANIKAIPTVVAKSFSSLDSNSLFAFGLGGFSILLMVFWPKLAKAKANLLPAPLVVVILCAIIAWFGNLSVKFINVPSDLFSTWRMSSLDFSLLIDNPLLIAAAFQLALIASMESLLCANAVDQLHDGPRAQLNKELAAQGIGNTLCGLLGVLPMTGVIVRSSANLSAGASTRLSTILHGVWLLVFVWLLPNILSFIPTAALAGILVYIGAKLINIKAVSYLYQNGKSELIIFLVTVSVIVTYDLLLGVLFGFILSSLKLLKQLSHLSIKVENNNNLKKCVIHMQGGATFLRLPKLANALEQIPLGFQVEINSNLYIMDLACQEYFNMWKKRHMQLGGKIYHRNL